VIAVGHKPGPIRVGAAVESLFEPILRWLGDTVQLDRRFTLDEIARHSPPSLRVAIAHASVGGELVRILDWSSKTPGEAIAEAAGVTSVCAVYLGTNQEMREVFLDAFTGWRLVGFATARHPVGLVLAAALHDRLLFLGDDGPTARMQVKPRLRWPTVVTAVILVIAGIAFPALIAVYAVVFFVAWMWRNRPV
jgi:hypothetical protein